MSRVIRTIVVLLGTTLLIAVPAAAQPSGTMTFGVHVTLATRWLDPADTDSEITPFMILYALHDALVKPMPGSLNAPCLAESWTMSKDGRTWEFVIRRGARFHNGDPVTAEDVKFSFERYKGAAAPLFKDRVREVQVVDATHVRFQLKEPWPDFMTFYGTSASGAAYVVPKKYVEKVGEEAYRKAPVGAGPYKFVSFQPGGELRHRRASDKGGGVMGILGPPRKHRPPSSGVRAADRPRPLRSKAREGFAGRSGLPEGIRRGGVHAVPAVHLDGRGDRELSRRRRHQDARPDDGARGLPHGLAREEAPGHLRRSHRLGPARPGPP